MWPIIRKYYLGLFIIFLVIFSIGVVVNTSSPNTTAQNILIVIVGALLIAVPCGTIYYLQDTRWGPRKREKRFLKSPFKELLANGFVRKENLATGKINDYTAIVMYSWEGGKPAITIDILFDLGVKDASAADSMIKEISKRNKPSDKFFGLPYNWSKNSIGSRFEYNFTPPSYEKIMQQGEKLTEVLIRERLHTMSLEEAVRLQNGD
jgi:hypothetical protein